MFSKYQFHVQERKRLRVIIDTDAACEADDQYAIVHALLTPRFDIRGIIAEQFRSEGGASSVEKSYAEIMRLLSLTGFDVPVYRGAEAPLASREDVPESAGAEFIIAEALSETERPLLVLCQGAITNVAAALNKCPDIRGRFTCVWIGGERTLRAAGSSTCITIFMPPTSCSARALTCGRCPWTATHSCRLAMPSCRRR